MFLRKASISFKPANSALNRNHGLLGLSAFLHGPLPQLKATWSSLCILLNSLLYVSGIGILCRGTALHAMGRRGGVNMYRVCISSAYSCAPWTHPTFLTKQVQRSDYGEFWDCSNIAFHYTWGPWDTSSPSHEAGPRLSDFSLSSCPPTRVMCNLSSPPRVCVYLESSCFTRCCFLLSSKVNQPHFILISRYTYIVSSLGSLPI